MHFASPLTTYSSLWLLAQADGGQRRSAEGSFWSWGSGERRRRRGREWRLWNRSAKPMLFVVMSATLLFFREAEKIKVRGPNGPTSLTNAALELRRVFLYASVRASSHVERKVIVWQQHGCPSRCCGQAVRVNRSITARIGISK